MTPQQQIIAELKTELAMRRKVWRKIAGSQDQFIEIDRVRRNKEAATAQTSLF